MHSSVLCCAVLVVILAVLVVIVVRLFWYCAVAHKETAEYLLGYSS